VTTGARARHLADDHCVDLARVTCDSSTRRRARDPPNVERTPAGKALATLLREGVLDAAILGEVPPADSPLKPLIPDPAAAARDWQRRHGAIQINHMVVVTEALARAQPDAVREAYRLLAEGKRIAGLPKAGDDTTPFGLTRTGASSKSRSTAYRQRLIPWRFTVDELFDDVTTRPAGSERVHPHAAARSARFSRRSGRSAGIIAGEVHADPALERRLLPPGSRPRRRARRSGTARWLRPSATAAALLPPGPARVRRRSATRPLLISPRRPTPHLAGGALEKLPDVVVSGINLGANMATTRFTPARSPRRPKAISWEFRRSRCRSRARRGVTTRPPATSRASWSSGLRSGPRRSRCC
jgi:hypothetical protein